MPESWLFIRLKELAYFSGGFAFKSNKFSESGVRVIRISDFDKNGIKNDKIVRYPYSDELLKNKIHIFDILMCMTGGTVGKSLLIESLDEESYINQRVAKITSFIINQKYLFNVLSSNYILSIINRAKNSTNDNISMDDIENFIIPLPPLEEQERIVKRIEELMPLVDEYARLEAKDKELDDKLPGMLKQSILQYAMEGKLVKQNPDDEPASVLLERIKIEKERLIKEGKIKRDKNETLIIQDDDKNYYENLPQNWTLTILNNLSSLITKGTTPRGGNVAYSEKGIGFLRAENVAGFYDIDLNNLKFVDEDTHRTFLKRSILQESDILITIAGTLGRTGYIKKEYLPLNTNQAIAIIRPLKNVYVPYIILSLNSPKIQNGLLSQEKITAIPNLTLEIISRCILPYPPLNEQIKIANKVASLFAILNVK